MDSKNIVITAISIIISLIMLIISETIPPFNINNIIWVYIITITSLIITLILIIAIHQRVNEIKEELIEQKSEIKKLDEKLKIYKRLAKIEERLKIR